jgi:formate hydrogenlyase subunit 4
MEKKSNEVINPTYIIAAGRNIKSVVYVILVMVVFTLIVLLVSALNPTENPEEIKGIYILLGVVSIICNLLILELIHSAGHNLENSVNKKVE